MVANVNLGLPNGNIINYLSKIKTIYSIGRLELVGW